MKTKPFNNQSPFLESQARHPIIAWFIQNPVAANLLMIFILLGGLYTVGFLGLFGQQAKIPLEAFPSFKVRTIKVNAHLNGLSPEEIESNVTQKVENSLQSIQGIEKITSESQDNFSSVTVHAKTGYNIDTLLEDVKTEVDSISNLPNELEKISVSKKKEDRIILLATLHGNTTEKQLKYWGNQLKDKLLLNPIVERISISGEKSYQVTIEINQDTLNTYELTFDEIATAIRNHSINLSVGELSSQKGKLTLSIKEQANNASDYNNIIIKSLSDGSSIRLSDIATITDDLEELDIINEFNQEPSISLEVYTNKQSNVIEGSQAVKTIVDEFKVNLPQNINATIWRDAVVNVKDRINLFSKNVLTGILLVFILLTLFLNLRLALWVALGIPISFAGAILLMQTSGISVNLITLFGFIIVLGIVVDDAIIIGESIYTWKKRTNNHPLSTIHGAARVSTSATFGVLTTIAAFLPLTQVDGEMGDILGQIGWVVIFCLIFSLVESKLILPAHLNAIQIQNNKTKLSVWAKAQRATANLLEKVNYKIYLPILKKALIYRYFTILLFISILMISFGLIRGGFIPVARFPVVESQYISLSVQMNNSVNAQFTQKWAKKAAQVLTQVDSKLSKEVGQEKNSVTYISVYTTDEKHFKIFAGLESAENRTISAPTISNSWRQALGDIDQAKSINFSARQRFTSTDIEIRILAENKDNATLAKTAILKVLKSYPSIADTSTTEDDEKDELIIHIKPEAAIYGITEKQIATAVRHAFYGLEVERLQRKGDEVKIMLKLPKSERKHLSDIESFFIRTHSGKSIPITELASFEQTSKPSTIYRLNKQRVINIYANVDKSKNSPDEIISEMSNNKIFENISKRYQVDISLGGEAEDGKKSDDSMKIGFIISLALIYILLAIPLKSYFKPFIIMAVIPFGIIGAILGHLLLSLNISIISMFGIIALSGVIVNDSLILMSSINQHRQQSLSHIASVIRSGLRRFRPIVLTSITTFAGITPMLFETSFQAQFLIPMAVSLGFGILFATAITLILVPVLYLVSCDAKSFFRFLLNKL